MADIDRIKRNLTKMVEQGAPEGDLDSYLKSEGFNSADEWRAAATTPAPADKPKPVGAAMAVQSPSIGDAPQMSPGPRTANMPDQPQGRSWLDVGKNALKNILPDTAKVAMEMVQPVVNPVATAKGLGALGNAFMSKLARPGDLVREGDAPPTPAELDERARVEAPLNALADHYANTYGALEGFKNAVAEQPAHVLMDVATVGTAGTMAPGKVGQAASVASKVDPVLQSGNALKLAGKGTETVASNALGMTTGAGTESIRAAGRAGREGGAAAEAFTENMRGAPVSDVVDRAKNALDALRAERSAAYKEGMAEVGKDATVLPFDSIDSAVAKATNVGTYKGVTTEPKAAATVQEMSDIVAQWKGLDPVEFHTPEGIDALKRTLGNIRDATAPNTPERVAADRIYNAVRQQIVDQAPEYAKVMEGYAKASGQLNEATRTFSLGERAAGDTAARKLLSATRNNVQTNYGERARLLDLLAEQDPSLPYAIAGQGLNALTPRGVVARGGAMVAAPSMIANPSNALLLPAFSPRVVGETVYLGGKVVGTVEDVAAKLGLSAEALRAAELAGYQAGNSNAIADRAKSLRDLNAVGAR